VRRGVYVRPGEVGIVVEALDSVIRYVTDWHAEHGRPEWRDQTLAPILSVRTRIREAAKLKARA